MEEFKANEFWEKRLEKIKGLEGVGYSKLGKQFNYWGYQIRKYAFLKIFNENTSKAPLDNVLDIGSGTGFYIDIWQKKNAKKIVGVDITNVAVENLKKTFPEHTFFQQDISADISSKTELHAHFNYISCMDVLFHIVDKEKFAAAMKNISTMLKKDGYFIYSDNFLNSETVVLTHQVSYSKKELYRLFHENGFEVVAHKPFMVLSNYPVDSKNIFIHAYWFCLENFVALFKPLGNPIGWLLFQIDKILINILDKSVTSEIVILRKK
jgi:SAM-dependent methyltransferase